MSIFDIPSLEVRSVVQVRPHFSPAVRQSQSRGGADERYDLVVTSCGLCRIRRALQAGFEVMQLSDPGIIPAVSSGP